eukprot:5028747-Pyramimonas_sp.AAC.1
MVYGYGSGVHSHILAIGPSTQTTKIATTRVLFAPLRTSTLRRAGTTLGLQRLARGYTWLAAIGVW